MTVSADLFSLAGKVAIVTGAGGKPGGIGEAYAAALAVFGAKVVLADINAAGANEAAERVTALGGGEAIGIACDISDKASVEAMVAQTVERFGGVDILVNNAALMVEIVTQRTSTISLEDWNRILAINLTGALLCAQAVAPHMTARGWGRIVNQSSSGAYPTLSVYGITKLAIAGLTTALAQELGRSGVTVNAIAPGVTDSGVGLGMRANPSRYSQILAELCPIHSPGKPDELCGALLYLCSEAGSWTTGQVLHVDGGAVMGK